MERPHLGRRAPDVAGHDVRRPHVERHTWIEAPFKEGLADCQHLIADGVWPIDNHMPPHAKPEDVSRDE